MSLYPTVYTEKLIPNPGDEKLIPCDWFITVEPSVVEDYYGHEIVIPVDYTTDGTSSPRWLWWLIPPHGKSFRASILHDYLFDVKFGQELWGEKEAIKKANEFFENQMRKDGVPEWQIKLMLFWVKLVGKYRWRRTPKVITYKRC